MTSDVLQLFVFFNGSKIKFMQLIGFLCFMLVILSNNKISGVGILQGSTFYYGSAKEHLVRTSNLSDVIRNRVKNLVIELASIFFLTEIVATLTGSFPNFYYCISNRSLVVLKLILLFYCFIAFLRD